MEVGLNTVDEPLVKRRRSVHAMAGTQPSRAIDELAAEFGIDAVNASLQVI